MQNKKKNMLFRKKILLILLLVLTTFFLSGCLKKKGSKGYKVNMEIWGVFDDSSVFESLFGDYREGCRSIGANFVTNMKYRKFTIEEYKKELLDALAAGNGPDIFMIQNSWVPQFEDKIVPAPVDILTEKEFRENFVDVAGQDLIGSKGEVYGVPLSVDSLVLYYNKDIFNANEITRPPKTWIEFNQDVQKLTKLDEYGKIIQAGAAIGTAYNINRSTDILNLLMLQNGVQMPTREDPYPVFSKTGEASNVVDFYTQFAKIGSPVYTWNPHLHYSLDTFYEGKVAMMFNYSWHGKTIQKKNSKLNFGVAPLPQLDPNNPVGYSNYWVLVVAKNKQKPKDNRAVNNKGDMILKGDDYQKARINEDWEFLKYIAIKHNKKFTLKHAFSGKRKDFVVKDDPTEKYLKATNKPAARRDLIEKQKNDPFLGSFVYENLIAKDWYQTEAEAMENIWAELINQINLGEITSREAVKTADVRMRQLIK